MLMVKTLSETQALLSARFSGKKMKTERVPVTEALGRVLCADIYARDFVPDFDRSTVDGYGVRAADTFGCSESIPAILAYKGEVSMGDPHPHQIGPGECMYVPTGGELPKGADAMVMIEYAEQYEETTRAILKSSAPGAHVIYRGDDVRPGDMILKRGTRLKPKDIGALAAIGYGSVDVYKRPRVCVFSTGDELVDVCDTPGRGQIRNVNSYTLDAALTEAGCEPTMGGVIRDEYSLLYEALQSAVKSYDMVLVSGGSSVGVKDSTARVIGELGELLLHGLAMKPGKPTIAGEVGGVPVFGLPGHPVAAYFIFSLIVKPLLCSFMDTTPTGGWVRAALSAAIPSNHGREECVPVRLEGGTAIPVMGKSGLITTLAQAEGYVRIPRDQEGLSRGEQVTVYLF